VTETILGDTPPAPTTDAGDAHRRSVTEAVLDNLPAWTVIAAAIGLLYLVWATIEILSRYVGGIPKVGP
jgi:hypothetical protein